MSDINLELAIEQVSNQQLQILDLGLDHHRVGHSAGFGQIAGRYQNIDRTAEWFVTDRTALHEEFEQWCEQPQLSDLYSMQVVLEMSMGAYCVR